MRLICPSNLEECVPLRITDANGTEGAMLGGRAPMGIRPRSAQSSLRYFATIPLTIDPALCLSLFVADFKEIVSLRGRVNELGFLSISRHPPLPRSTEPSQSDSALSEHNLWLLEATSDWIEDEEGKRLVRPNHKLGGRPYLVRQKTKLTSDLDELRRIGFIMVAQFDFPTGDDAVVSGNWPFGDGMFALFGREPFSEEDWKWYWDF